MKNKVLNKLIDQKYEKKNRLKRRIATALILSMGLISYKQYEISTHGLEVVYGDKKIGVVKEEAEAIALVDELEKDLSQKLDKDIKLEDSVSFKQTNLRKEQLTEKDDMKKNLERTATYCAIGYAIEVNGEDVAYLDTQDSAKEAIVEYKESFTNHIQQSDIKSVELVEQVSVSKREVKVDKIDDIESTVSQLKSKMEEKQTHIIEGEENYYTLSLQYGMSIDELKRLNPDKNTEVENLKAGDEVVVSAKKPVLTVETLEKETTERETDFEIVYQPDDSLFQNEERVIVKGEKGLIEEQAEVKKVNGEQIDRKVLVETVKKQPVMQIVSKGTKEVPTTKPTGQFMVPVAGHLTSSFGARWGRAHAGIDIGAGIGETIMASDGGTVTYAQFNNGGYGNMVQIDHGNGFVTRYAHASQLFVSNGQKVAKGEKIAAVGNTGRSTGPHLHFEIRKNDVPQNPAEYCQ